MKLCDQCILNLKSELPQEVKVLLKEGLFPLFEEREEVTGKELAQVIGGGRIEVKKVIDYLRSHLLLTSSFQGRTQFYSLTETAWRYYQMEKNPELVDSNSNLGKETNEKQKTDNKAWADSLDKAEKDKPDTNKVDKNKKESDKSDADKAKESKSIEDDSGNKTKGQGFQKTEQKNLTWDIDI